jgi:transcriptional regulator with XRE-family HTH domain
MARPSRLARGIRELRESAELSKEAVAHSAGLTVSAYARVERGEANPTWTTVTQIARGLNVSLADLAAAFEKRR